MIVPNRFYEALNAAGIELFAGVPDSLLASLCAYIDDASRPDQHIITANEGNAIALGAGFHLATGKSAAVYMQNSGLGNAVNPLASLTAAEVYRIPMLLIIGWRGEPGVADEPQHIKQGLITREQLDILGIPYWILDAASDADTTLAVALEAMHRLGTPVALLVRKDTFSVYKSKRKAAFETPLKREDALREVLDLCEDRLIVSTTGKTSREVFELRKERNEPQKDFLTVGAMGHTASIALGVAIGNPCKQVVCIDGDGSVLMHLGALPIIGDVSPPNFLHVLLNNAAHESVGGQPTVADEVDFAAISRACGYRSYELATDANSIRRAWKSLANKPGPNMLEIRISTGARADLGRPTSTAEENKLSFMNANTR